MITVVAVTADFKVKQHIEAIKRTMFALPVPSVGLLISPTQPKGFGSIIWQPLTKDWCPGGQWTKADYSRFMLQGLVDFIDTEFCITCQWDGFGINRHHWSDEFLEYDYIGAPWPASMNSARVGNGGFSLRSKRWLAACARIPMPGNGEPEDDWACRVLRSDMEAQGCHIAPLSIAAQFSIEHQIPEYANLSVQHTFGFHGHFSPETHRLVFP